MVMPSPPPLNAKGTMDVQYICAIYVIHASRAMHMTDMHT